LSTERPIRIFIDAHNFDKEFQGTRTFLKGLYIHMAQLNYPCAYYFAAQNIENLQREFGENPQFNFIQYKSGLTINRVFIEIPAIIKKYKIDFAHFQYISPFLKHCKYIVTCHDILFNDFKTEFGWFFRTSRNFLFKYGIQHADIRTTVSNYSVERLAHHYQLEASSIKVIPNCVSEEFFESYNKVDAEDYIQKKYGIAKYLLYVSRIEPRKNNAMALQAFLNDKLYDKGFSLVFIGKTSIVSQELNQLIERMPKEAKLKFFHFEQVDQIDLMQFYKAAKIFIYPSKAEGFGIPPLEAAALKIPVLCSNKTAMSDYTFFGNNLFDPENQIELDDKLRKLTELKIDVDLNKISTEIATLYNWKKSATILFGLINEMYVEMNKRN